MSSLRKTRRRTTQLVWTTILTHSCVIVYLDDDNRFFWTAGAEGELRFLRCQGCGYFVHPPGPRCPRCHSDRLAPEAVSGRGEVHSFTINHQPWAPGLEVPFVIARVRLDGVPGVILTTNIVNCPVDEVNFDDKVRVTFDEQDGIFYPLFEKVA